MKKATRFLPTFLGLAFLFVGNALAAQEGMEREKIKVSGTGTTKTIECNGNEVFVSGNRHNVTVKGFCLILTVYGNNCIIEMENVRLITLHGDKNRIRYQVDPQIKTKVLRFGDFNVVATKPASGPQPQANVFQ